MNYKRKLMNKFIKQTGTKTFMLFYKLMRGNFKIDELNEEEKIISQCVRNECTEPNGDCYMYYKEISKIKKTKNVKKILYLQECILKIMCEKVFFNALKLGFVMKESLNKNCKTQIRTDRNCTKNG